MKQYFTYFSRLAVIVGSGFVCLAMIAIVSGHEPTAVVKEMILGGWDSYHSSMESLLKAIPIMLCAIAVALPKRIGLVNLGAEGQLLMGAIFATIVVMFVPTTNSVVLISLMVFSALVAGGLWGAVPGALKGMTGASETVVSLLMNYVAGLFLLYLIHGPLKDPASLGWAQSPSFPDAARLSSLWGSRVHAIGIWGVLISILLFLFFWKTPWGIVTKVLFHSTKTARYLGYNANRYSILLFILGGALAGLAGFGEVSAVHGRLREGLSPQGYGYVGFLVAWLCGGRFEWIPVVAIFFGGVLSGADGLQISLGLPASTMYVVLGAILLMVIIFDTHRVKAV